MADSAARPGRSHRASQAGHVDVTILIGVFCAAMAMFAWSIAPPDDGVQTLAVVHEQGVAARVPIRDLRVGDWVLADNPQAPDAETAPADLTALRKVTFELRDEASGLTTVALLRPAAWIADRGIYPYATVPLDLSELGAAGDAVVTSVGPCPRIAPAPGPGYSLVTGTFTHERAAEGVVVDLHLEGLDKPIGVTLNHPVWCVERDDFVPVGDLAVGNHLRDAAGAPVRLTAIEPRAGPHTVHNLEVHGRHVYHVSKLGILAHNKGGGCRALVPKAPAKLGEWGEQRLAAELNFQGYKPSQALKTRLGNRYVDRLHDGIAHEAKAGINVKLTSSIEMQVLKDVELIARERVRGARWHFFQGADDELLKFLRDHGIDYKVY